MQCALNYAIMSKNVKVGDKIMKFAEKKILMLSVD